MYNTKNSLNNENKTKQKNKNKNKNIIKSKRQKGDKKKMPRNCGNSANVVK